MAVLPMLSSEYWSEVGRSSQIALTYWTPAFIAFAAYVPGVFILQWVMKSREPLKLKWSGFVWNITLSILSGIGAAMIVYEMPGIFAYHFYPESDYGPLTRMSTGIFALTKGLEFGDTLFLILRKRPVILLHWYHHVTVAMYSWHAATTMVPLAHWCATINLVIHFIMYGYYAAGTLYARHPLLRFLRPYITGMQTVQMFVGIYLSARGLYSGNIFVSEGQRLNTWLCLVMYISYAYLFTAFYIDNYVKHMKVGMALFLGTLYAGAIGGFWIIWVHPEWKRLTGEVITGALITVALCTLAPFPVSLPLVRDSTVKKETVGTAEEQCELDQGEPEASKASVPVQADVVEESPAAPESQVSGSVSRAALMLLNCTAVWGYEHHAVHHKLQQQSGKPKTNKESVAASETTSKSKRRGEPADRASSFSLINALVRRQDATIASVPIQSAGCPKVLSVLSNTAERWAALACVAIPIVYSRKMYGSALIGLCVHGCLRWVVELHSSGALGIFNMSSTAA